MIKHTLPTHTDLRALIGVVNCGIFDFEYMSTLNMFSKNIGLQARGKKDKIKVPLYNL